MLNANMGQQMGCIWLDRLHRAAQGVSMAAHGVHMAAQRLLLGWRGARDPPFAYTALDLRGNYGKPLDEVTLSASRVCAKE